MLKTEKDFIYNVSQAIANGDITNYYKLEAIFNKEGLDVNSKTYYILCERLRNSHNTTVH